MQTRMQHFCWKWLKWPFTNNEQFFQRLMVWFEHLSSYVGPTTSSPSMRGHEKREEAQKFDVFSFCLSKPLSKSEHRNQQDHGLCFSETIYHPSKGPAFKVLAHWCQQRTTSPPSWVAVSVLTCSCAEKKSQEEQALQWQLHGEPG
jgi:hypothetical protein